MLEVQWLRVRTVRDENGVVVTESQFVERVAKNEAAAVAHLFMVHQLAQLEEVGCLSRSEISRR
jgi:hypothetical protein